MTRSKKYYIIYAIVGVLILFIAFVGFNFLKSFPLFSSENSFYIYYDRVDGLNVANPVTINGFKVGKVSEIELVPEKNCSLKVTIKVSKKYKLPKGTIAKIESTDLLGSKGIRLEYGNASEYISSGEELDGNIEQSLKDQVSVQMLPVKQKAEDLMSEMSNVMEIISNVFNETTRNNLINSISSLNRTIIHLESALNNLDFFIQDELPYANNIISNINEITKTIKTNKDELDNTLKNLSSFSDSLSVSNIKTTIDKTNGVLNNLDDIIYKINQGDGSIGELINDRKLLTDLEKTVNSLNLLIEDLKENPKRYVHFSLIDRGEKKKKKNNINDSINTKN